LPPKQSQGMGITSQVSEMQLQATTINTYTAAAEENPATWEYYSSQIDSVLDDMQDSVSSITGALNDAQDLEDLASSLPIALQSIYSNIQNMKGALPISDINSFKVINNSLYNSTLAAKTENTLLAEQAIIRRK